MTGLSIDNAGIHVFAFTLHWYGIAVVLGVWIAAETASWLAAREGRDPGHVWQGLMRVGDGGLLGARLWYVLFPPESVVANGFSAGWFLAHVFDVNHGVIALWTGGLGLIGGVIGGVLGLAFYAKRRGLPILPWLDIAAVALPLGQAIGRLGGAFNQELYGPVTDLPWGMLIDNPDQRVGPYTDLARYPLQSTRFHPVYLYESLWTALVFAVLLVVFLRYRDRFWAGDMALLYVVTYGLGRFLLEFMRVNVSFVGRVNISQAVMVGAGLVAIAILLWRRRTNVLPSSGSPSRDFHNSAEGSRLQLG
jgi:phosphatidylglycerol:prolipoprotein diacylglycerol transferase